MPEPTLTERVLSELRVLRKDSPGVRVETLARATTICQLLGAGDPYLAYTRLQHALLDASPDRTIRAAAASLGFASDGATHLDRLVEGGDDLHLEQRQVRRLSDQGLAAIARLIATNWTVDSVPELTALVWNESTLFELRISTLRPVVVEMKEPNVEVLVGTGRVSHPLNWIVTDTETHSRALSESVVIPRTMGLVSVVIIWRGELWPKYNTRWHGEHSDVASEVLGNKLMLRLCDRADSFR